MRVTSLPCKRPGQAAALEANGSAPRELLGNVGEHVAQSFEQRRPSAFSSLPSAATRAPCSLSFASSSSTSCLALAAFGIELRRLGRARIARRRELGGFLADRFLHFGELLRDRVLSSIDAADLAQRWK